MSMGHHDQIDQRHQIQIETRLALAFDNAVPLRPVGVDDHRMIGELNKKGGVSNPSDPYFPRLRRVRNGFFD